MHSTVLKGLAYPVNGIIMGGLDWKFTMAVRDEAVVSCLLMPVSIILSLFSTISLRSFSRHQNQAMWLANFACVGLIRFWAKANTMTLEKVWWALAVFMGTQVATGAIRFQSKTGVWKILRAEKGTTKGE